MVEAYEAEQREERAILQDAAAEAERSQAQRDCCREGRELVHEAPTAGTYNRTTYFDRYEGIADLDAWRRAP